MRCTVGGCLDISVIRPLGRALMPIDGMALGRSPGSMPPGPAKASIHALDQGQGRSAAGGQVGQFMADDGFNLVSCHRRQQPGGRRHPGRILESAGSGGSGRACAEVDLRLLQPRLICKAFDGADPSGTGCRTTQFWRTHDFLLDGGR
jgi:hypothetical protein